MTTKYTYAAPKPSDRELARILRRMSQVRAGRSEAVHRYARELLQGGYPIAAFVALGFAALETGLTPEEVTAYITGATSRRLVLQRADEGPQVFISAEEARARRTPPAAGPGVKSTQGDVTT